jgi:hypothetical protein
MGVETPGCRLARQRLLCRWQGTGTQQAILVGATERCLLPAWLARLMTVVKGKQAGSSRDAQTRMAWPDLSKR